MNASIDEIRLKAASAVAVLANRCESLGRSADASSSPKAGWVRSGGDVNAYIFPAKLREAVSYYDIAISIFPQPVWIYTKALLLEQLGDFADAEHAYAALVHGAYASHGSEGAKRCASKRQGTYGNGASLEAAFADLAGGILTRSSDAGGSPDVMQDVRDLVKYLNGSGPAAAVAAPVATPPGEARTRANPSTDLALLFVNRLLHREYGAARELLHGCLSRTTAAELRQSFEALFVDEEFPDTARVFDALPEWPDQSTDDVAWVYVTIDSRNAEAVRMIVSREGGKLAIREIQWGRP